MIDFSSILKCKACQLADVRRQVVIGRGRIPASILAMGEAPGRSEDMLGKAFIGEAGRLLDILFIDVGIDIEDVYRTNIVLCHPSDKFAGNNREPAPDEIIACMGNVLTIIDAIKPQWIILVGDYAFRYYSKTFPGAFHIMHPAALLRSGGQSSPYYVKQKRILQMLVERIKSNVSN